MKIRKNEDEEYLHNPDARLIAKTRTKSAHYDKDKDPPNGDICQFTIREVTVLESEFEHFAGFPFDRLPFDLRFELSHFERGKNTIRFDFYH